MQCKHFVFCFQQQLQAYVAWVNSQLKKKPAVKPVQDLRQDLRDGVTLALLIEIVGQWCHLALFFPLQLWLWCGGAASALASARQMFLGVQSLRGRGSWKGRQSQSR